MPLDSELHKCANKGDLAGIKELVENDGADVNALGANDRTPLHRAAGSGQVEVVQYLLRCGAMVEATDRYQRTPLFWAAIGGHVKVVDELLQAGATPIAATTTGTTIFMAAVGSGPNSAATVEALLAWVEAHPDKYTLEALLSPEDNEGKTAYQLAKDVDKEMAKVIKLRAPQCVPPEQQPLGARLLAPVRAAWGRVMERVRALPRPRLRRQASAGARAPPPPDTVGAPSATAAALQQEGGDKAPAAARPASGTAADADLSASL